MACDSIGAKVWHSGKKEVLCMSTTKVTGMSVELRALGLLRLTRGLPILVMRSL